MTGWAWVDTGYACGGVEFNDGVITRAPPIFKWAVGKSINQFLRWRKINESLVMEDES